MAYVYACNCRTRINWAHTHSHSFCLRRSNSLYYISLSHREDCSALFIVAFFLCLLLLLLLFSLWILWIFFFHCWTILHFFFFSLTFVCEQVKSIRVHTLKLCIWIKKSEHGFFPVTTLFSCSFESIDRLCSLFIFIAI